MEKKRAFKMPDKALFFHTAQGRQRKSYLFAKPVMTITCHDGFSVLSALKRVDEYVSRGYYAAGYMAYEAGAFLAPGKIKPAPHFKAPLLKFGIYRKPEVFTNLILAGKEVFTSGVKPDTGLKEYRKKFNKIRRLITNGEVYQVNYCFRMNFGLQGSPESLFNAMCERQPVKYAALFKDGAENVISMSPELFFEVDNGAIKMKPMKGTLLKPCKAADLAAFKSDPKTSAENIMIVDLIRNDLGRICSVNTIRAKSLFEVEEYDTLYQMTSTVTGKLKNNTGFSGIISALFPSGSVTGAPKIMAMQIIREIEKSGRGIYTGAIGFISPHMKKAVFNIPIRTASIYKNTGIYGVGSGIVYDSRAADEYMECLGKAAILKPDFKIIESMLHSDKGCFLFSSHIRRMKKSAEFFGFPFPEKKAVAMFAAHARKLPDKKRFKVRLLLNSSGCMKIESAEIKNKQLKTLKAAVSGIRVNSGDHFLRHKTTRRALYDSELKKYGAKGFSEVLFFNEKGELTEACSSNVFVEKNGIFYTPPVSCGLLPGTYRAYLLAKGGKYMEKVIREKDLKSADAVYVCNSVRGLRRISCVSTYGGI